MEPIVLTDASVKPDDDLIYSIIGEKAIHWQNAMKYLNDNFTEITQKWNYYRDGKCWLLKTDRKKKTLFWTGVQKDAYRISFWFGEKAERTILESDLPEQVKEEYRNAKRYKIGRGISVILKDPGSVESFKKLVMLKSKIK